MTDITSPRLLYLKGFLMLLGGLLASATILLEHPDWKLAALLVVAVWCFARAYYFAFYVIEHYVDDGYRFSGLWSFARYLLDRRQLTYPIAFNSGTSSRERGRDPGPMPSLDGPSPKLLAGIAFYVVTAAADTLLTLQGVNGDLQLEGNPIMQAAMEHLGMGLGLVTQKAAIGGGALFIAVAGERAIRRDEPWIWKIPTTRWVRDWMRRRDRSWIAFIPLYAVATGQAFAVASWLALMATL